MVNKKKFFYFWLLLLVGAVSRAQDTIFIENATQDTIFVQADYWIPNWGICPYKPGVLGFDWKDKMSWRLEPAKVTKILTIRDVTDRKVTINDCQLWKLTASIPNKKLKIVYDVPKDKLAGGNFKIMFKSHQRMPLYYSVIQIPKYEVERLEKEWEESRQKMPKEMPSFNIFEKFKK